MFNTNSKRRSNIIIIHQSLSTKWDALFNIIIIHESNTNSKRRSNITGLGTLALLADVPLSLGTVQYNSNDGEQKAGLKKKRICQWQNNSNNNDHEQ